MTSESLLATSCCDSTLLPATEATASDIRFFRAKSVSAICSSASHCFRTHGAYLPVCQNWPSAQPKMVIANNASNVADAKRYLN